MIADSLQGFFEQYELLSNRLYDERVRVGTALGTSFVSHIQKMINCSL